MTPMRMAAMTPAVARRMATVALVAVAAVGCSDTGDLDAAADAANAVASGAVEGEREWVMLGRTTLDNTPVPSGFEGRVLQPLPLTAAVPQVLHAVDGTALEVTGQTEDGAWVAQGAGTTLQLSFSEASPGTEVTYRVTLDEDEDDPARPTRATPLPEGPVPAGEVVSSVAVDDSFAGAASDPDVIAERLQVLELPPVPALGDGPVWFIRGGRGGEVELTLPVTDGAARVLTLAPSDEQGERIAGVAGVALVVADVPTGATAVTFQAAFSGLYWLD